MEGEAGRIIRRLAVDATTEESDGEGAGNEAEVHHLGLRAPIWRNAWLQGLQRRWHLPLQAVRGPLPRDLRERERERVEQATKSAAVAAEAEDRELRKQLGAAAKSEVKGKSDLEEAAGVPVPEGDDDAMDIQPPAANTRTAVTAEEMQATPQRGAAASSTEAAAPAEPQVGMDTPMARGAIRSATTPNSEPDSKKIREVMGLKVCAINVVGSSFDSEEPIRRAERRWGKKQPMTATPATTMRSQS